MQLRFEPKQFDTQPKTLDPRYTILTLLEKTTWGNFQVKRNSCYNDQCQGHFSGPSEGDSKPFCIPVLGMLDKLTILCLPEASVPWVAGHLSGLGFPPAEVPLPADDRQGQAVFDGSCTMCLPSGTPERPAWEGQPAES